MRSLPLILDIFLARVDGHIAQLDDFLQPLLQMLNVRLLFGYKLSVPKQMKYVSKIFWTQLLLLLFDRCKQRKASADAEEARSRCRK